VKITLNDTIPVARRPQVEKLVRSFVRSPEIVWLPSRFPHLVMFIDPGVDDPTEPEKSSIFESPRAGMKSTASITAILEDHINACLAGTAPQA
jgi:hypothetical protein